MSESPKTLLSTAAKSMGQGVPFKQARNWHDKMMQFNGGRAFDMTLMPLPDDACQWVSINYKAGDPESKVAPKFKDFNGVVDGLLWVDGTFTAYTYYGADGRTPHNTYLEAIKKLDGMGFNTAPTYETEGNGWNSLVQFYDKEVCAECVRGAHSGWIVLPSQPRTAENALPKGVAVLAIFNHGDEVTKEPKSYEAEVDPADDPEAPEEEIVEAMEDAALGEGDMVIQEETAVEKLIFLLSGRYEDKDTPITHINDAGHIVVANYDGNNVSVVVVPNLNSQAYAAKKAREDDSVDLITIDDLEDYLEKH